MQYANLLGIPFEAGKNDCYSLLQKFYAQNYDIHLRNYARPTDWNANEINIMDEAFKRENFVKLYDWTISALQPGDLLCMAIGTSVGNHYAVYVGENKIIHHRYGILSNEEVLRDFWRQCTVYVLRHKDVVYDPQPEPTRDIRELLDERNRLKATEAI